MFKFQTPFCAILAGPSRSGKSSFVCNVIRYHELVINGSESRMKVLWCFGVKTEQMNQTFENSDITFHEGLPSEEDLEGYKFVIIDDLMSESSRSEEIMHMFTKNSHHKGISLFILVQNIFYKSNVMRNINLNAQYIIIFKNPRDKLQIQHFSKQYNPSKPQQLLEAFEDATSRPYGYLLIDLTPSIDDKFRLRSNIFPEDQNHVTVYIPK